MKIIHIITIASALTCASAVSAQTFVKEMNGANTRFIPGRYMKNGEATIYFSDDEYGYTDGNSKYSAEIFDFELKALKSFNFPSCTHTANLRKELRRELWKSLA